MKGILLAGGSGSRLRPLTWAVSKQLLPVYDKPMVYYPMTTLMTAGIRDILVIVAHGQRQQFERLLGDGRAFGIRLTFCEQAQPDGIAEALLLARTFLDGAPVMLALGDNLLLGAGLQRVLNDMVGLRRGALVLGYRVARPERYGVLTFDGGEVVSIVEKPTSGVSNWAVPGLYAYGADAPVRAARLVPSARGELEITDLHRDYLADGQLSAHQLDEGEIWLDMGTHDDLAEASALVAALQRRRRELIGSPERVAWERGWIDDAAVKQAIERHRGTEYADLLQQMLCGPRA